MQGVQSGNERGLTLEELKRENDVLAAACAAAQRAEAAAKNDAAHALKLYRDMCKTHDLVENRLRATKRTLRDVIAIYSDDD